MRRILFFFFAVLFAAPVAAKSAPAPAPANAPLPNSAELLQRALANQRKLAAERERYECRVRDTTVETDSRGNVKKTTTEIEDRFFVNGIALERTLQKNGKDLTPEETKKEDERIMKETLKYSNQANAQKVKNNEDQNTEDFMEAMMLTNGHRERVNGRSVLIYDIVPNLRFAAKNMNQRAARALQGKLSIDEQAGVVIDMDVKSVVDLKVGGGLLMNLHKGFWLHIHNHFEPDGVWLSDLVEGSGDARAALFFHPYFRFKGTTDGCYLYTATAAQVGPAQLVKKP